MNTENPSSTPLNKDDHSSPKCEYHDISGIYIDYQLFRLIDCTVIKQADLFKGEVLPDLIHVSDGGRVYFFRQLDVFNYCAMRQLLNAQKGLVEKGSLVESIYRLNLKRFWGIHKFILSIWEKEGVREFAEACLKDFAESFYLKGWAPPLMTPETSANWKDKLTEYGVYIIDPAESFQIVLPLISQPRETLSLGNNQSSEITEQKTVKPTEERYTKGDGVRMFVQVSTALGGVPPTESRPPIVYSEPHLTPLLLSDPEGKVPHLAAVTVEAEVLDKATQGKGPVVGHVIETGQAVVLVSQGVVEPIKGGKVTAKKGKKEKLKEYVAPESMTSGNITQVVASAPPDPPKKPIITVEVPDHNLPGDPSDKHQRLTIMQAALRKISSIYPPHCLPWLRLERRDLLGDILRAEIDVEYEVINGTPKTVIAKCVELIRVFQNGLTAWELAHHNEKCERCALEGHGITKPSIKTKQRLCPWCLVIVNEGAPCYTTSSPFGVTQHEHTRSEQNALSDLQGKQSESGQ